MDCKIVLVTDAARDNAHADLLSQDLEGNSLSATYAIRDALAEFSSVILYTDFDDFREHIKQHKSDIVFPMRYGPTSRTEKGLVVSLCEAYRIPFLGADVYTQILCNDKDLSKKYAREFGFSAPNGIVFRQGFDEDLIVSQINRLNLPLVVKPNFGGGSAGISDKSLVHSYQAAINLVKMHLKNSSTPILAEEYIAGQEVSILLIGDKRKMTYYGETQLVIDGQNDYKNRIWGYEEKKIDDSMVEYKVSHLISEQTYQQAIQLFQSFEKVEYMRIDGRVNCTGFHLIELSPDCYLGPESDFEVALREKGLTYPEMLQLLIKNFLDHD